MKTTIQVLSFAAILAVVAAPAAFADTVLAPNTSLSGPGVYYGSTTGNSNWNTITVTGTGTDKSTLQLGLEAITRFVGPIAPHNGDDYTYAPGPGTAPNLATWDFAFSVNTGSDPLSDFTYSITITDDTTHQTAVFDPTTTLSDNALAKWNGTSSQELCHATNADPCTYSGADDGFQNAENLGFLFLQAPGTPPSGFSFNPNSTDKYTISLSADPNPLLTDFIDPSISIDVVPPVAPPAVPEPSSLMLLGTGLISVVGVARRKFKA